MNDALTREVASQFQLSEEELQKEGIKAFLHDRLHWYEVERQHIFRKYQIKSFEEFDNYVAEHPDKESDLLADFQRADFLTFRIQEIKKLFQRLNRDD